MTNVKCLDADAAEDVIKRDNKNVKILLWTKSIRSQV